ncbi:MAG: hypothetical protein MHMPM18_001772 [Marteilia pararefringens]
MMIPSEFNAKAFISSEKNVSKLSKKLKLCKISLSCHSNASCRRKNKSKGTYLIDERDVKEIAIKFKCESIVHQFDRVRSFERSKFDENKWKIEAYSSNICTHIFICLPATSKIERINDSDVNMKCDANPVVNISNSIQYCSEEDSKEICLNYEVSDDEYLNEIVLKNKHITSIKLQVPSPRHIDVSHNLISSLLFLNSPNNLRTLNLSNNKLEILPMCLLFLDKLSYLDISHNIIRNVPWNINKMKNMKSINISDNLIDSLPSSLVTSMDNLSHLDVSNNKFSESNPQNSEMCRIPSLMSIISRSDSLSSNSIDEIIPSSRFCKRKCEKCYSKYLCRDLFYHPLDVIVRIDEFIYNNKPLIKSILCQKCISKYCQKI